MIAYLATLRLGAIVVPMNLAYRQREIEHMLSDAEPRLMVTEEAQLEVLSEVGEDGLSTVEELVLVEGLDRWLADGTPTSTSPSAHRPIAGSDLALLMYTSGTTGPSKGARLTHDNILATVTGLLAAWDWSDQDTLLLTLPLFHTHGLIVGLTTALAAGATVRLHRKFEPTAVWAELLSGEVDLFFGVPTLYRRLLDHAAGHRARYDLRHMRLLCSGSAPLSADVHETFRSVTGQTLLERYGMTETGMNLSNPYAGERRPGTVGTPLPGVSARIVDAEGCRVVEGEQGELEVRGGNVFDGYWRAPEKTRESFTSDESGQRWFCTGDLARCDPDNGYFTLLGRSTELIISGGYNIYPREVEEVLCAFPGITEAAVVGVPSEEWGEVGIAYVVCTSSFARDDLLAFCRRHIAAFKVPKEIRPIEALPRNALGKVQKHRLPQ